MRSTRGCRPAAVPGAAPAPASSTKRPAQEQVRVRLHGDAHPAVHLDAALGGEDRRLARRRLGGVHLDLRRRAGRCRPPTPAYRVRSQAALRRRGRLGELERDPLVRADHPAELLAGAGLLGGAGRWRPARPRTARRRRPGWPASGPAPAGVTSLGAARVTSDSGTDGSSDCRAAARRRRRSRPRRRPGATKPSACAAYGTRVRTSGSGDTRSAHPAAARHVDRRGEHPAALEHVRRGADRRSSSPLSSWTAAACAGNRLGTSRSPSASTATSRSIRPDPMPPADSGTPRRPKSRSSGPSARRGPPRAGAAARGPCRAPPPPSDPTVLLDLLLFLGECRAHRGTPLSVSGAG